MIVINHYSNISCPLKAACWNNFCSFFTLAKAIFFGVLVTDETISNAPTVSTTIPFNTKLKSDPDGAKTPQSLEEIFGSKSSQLFLLQLPDTLPGTVLDTSKADSRKDGDDQDTSNTVSFFLSVTRLINCFFQIRN